MDFIARQVQLLLTPDDEDRLVREIRSKYPEVKFLSNVHWESPDRPPLRESVAACGDVATIWNPVIHPTLPVDVRSDGRIFGPSVGPVVQWVRSLEKVPGVLDAGRWAAGVDRSRDAEMASFIGSIWRILYRCTTNRMMRTAGACEGATEIAPERNFRVGDEAFKCAMENVLVLRSGAMYIRPER